MAKEEKYGDGTKRGRQKLGGKHSSEFWKPSKEMLDVA